MHLYGGDEIRQAWSADDPQTYGWSFSSPKARISTVLGRTTGLLLVPPLLMLPFWGLGLLLPTVAYWLAMALLGALLVIFLFVMCLIPLVGTEKDKQSVALGRQSLAYAVLSLAIIVLAMPGSTWGKGFIGGQDVTPLGWLAFFYDNVFDPILLGIPGVLGVRLSLIEPESTWALGLTTGIRFLIGLGVVDFLWRQWKLSLAKEQFYGTVRDCLDHVCELPGTRRVEVRRHAVVEDRDGGTIALNTFTEAYRYPDKPECPRPWDWTEEAIYRWELRANQDTKRGDSPLGAAILVSLVFPWLVYGLFATLAWVWPWLARTLCAGCVFILVFFYGSMLMMSRLHPDRKQRAWARHTRPMSAVLAAVALITLLAVPGSTWGTGFANAEGAGIWRWLVFLLDNLIDTLVFGIPGIFHWHISAITPESPTAQTLTTLLRLFVAAGAVEHFLLAWRLRKGKEGFFGTLQEFHSYCSGFVKMEGAQVACTGRVDHNIAESSVMDHRDFLAAYGMESEAQAKRRRQWRPGVES